MKTEKYFPINSNKNANDFYSLFHLDINKLIDFSFDNFITKELQMTKKVELFDDFGSTFIESYKTKEHFHILDYQFGDYQFTDKSILKSKIYTIFLDAFEYNIFDSIAFSFTDNKVSEIKFIGNFANINGKLFFTEHISVSKIENLLKDLIFCFGNDDYGNSTLNLEEKLNMKNNDSGFYRHWTKKSKVRLELYSYGLVLSKLL